MVTKAGTVIGGVDGESARSTVYTLAQLGEMILPLVERYGMEAASVFGSYARGEATPDSDIDVLLYGGDSFRHFDVFAVAEDLYEASGKRVDVYEVSELDDGPFRDVVLREAVAL